MADLQPFDDDLAPERVALAQALRDLFRGLEISERRYAVRRSYDSSTVSRFLNGKRLASWTFVLNLLHDVAEKRGTVPTAETTEMLRALHMAAAKAGKSPVHKVQLLEQKLARADEEARRTAQRERWLEDTLQDREHRIRDLQMRQRELETALAEGASYGGYGDGTDEELARLRAEVAALQEELERTREHHRAAEERCERLERELAEAEGRGRLPDTAGAPDVARTDERAPASGEPAGVDLRNAHFNGDVYFNSDTWAVDEDFVDAVTVRVGRGGRFGGNGLLLDAGTVVTTAGAVLHPDPAVGSLTVTTAGGHRVAAVVAECLPAWESGDRYQWGFPNLALLKLADPVDGPFHVPDPGVKVAPGSRLLVSGYGLGGARRWERHSCVLQLQGRTGDWLRVEGELVDGLTGAPAFHSASGALAGLVSARLMEGQGGLLTPVAALRGLTSLRGLLAPRPG
ncbi:hypothetical protein T261_4587 [Streptomyces lydicus]|nr:hypothetical protein T261_4587 [Streptomyces lydicus]